MGKIDPNENAFEQALLAKERLKWIEESKEDPNEFRIIRPPSFCDKCKEGFFW